MADFTWGSQQTRHGAIPIAVPATADDSVAAAICDGTFGEPGVVDLIRKLLATDGCLFDIGAHLGTISLPVALDGSNVVAVEASPTNAAALSASIERNGATVQLVRAALSDVEATLTFVDDGPYSRVDDHPTESVQPSAVTISALTLLQIVEATGHRPTVMKIDVEGHETNCLRALMAYAAQGAPLPDLVIESNGHTLWLNGVSTHELVAQLQDMYRSVYLIDNGSLRPISPNDTQAQTVVDLFATNATSVPWTVHAGLSERQARDRLSAELASSNEMQQRWAHDELARYPQFAQSDSRLRQLFNRAR